MSSSRHSAKRLRPKDVVTHRRLAPPVEFSTVAELIRARPVLARSCDGAEAWRMAAYLAQAQRVLVAHLRAAEQYRAAEFPVDALLGLRTAWETHLTMHCHALSRAPPTAGGDTARWTFTTMLWTVICMANCVARRAGLGGAELATFDPSESAYLCRQRVVVTHGPVSRYSLRTADAALDAFVARLDLLDSFEPDYERYRAALEHRFGELVCTAGGRAAGFDAPEWTLPARHAHTTNRRAEGEGGAEEACTTDLIAQAFWRFEALRHYADVYVAVGVVYLNGAHVPVRRSRAEMRALSWAPTPRSLYRLREFACDAAHTMTADDYRHSMRDFVRMFEPLGPDANIYRMYRGTTVAIPRNVLEYAFVHRSPTGVQYVREIKYTRPVVEWLHDEANARAGDSTVRSDAPTRLAFQRQLGLLHILHTFIASRWSVEFRKHFLMFHRFVARAHAARLTRRSDPAFSALFEKARNIGWPFIVQQFGFWAVVVPHTVPPDRDRFTVERSGESTEAKRDHAATKRLAHEMRVDADDDDSSGSYSYTYDSDSGSDTPLASAERRGPSTADRLAQEMARLNIEAAADERGEPFDLRRPITESQRPTLATTNLEFVRAYECGTLAEAFVLWAAALLRVNRGIVNGRELAPFLTGLFDWQVSAQ